MEERLPRLFGSNFEDTKLKYLWRKLGVLENDLLTSLPPTQLFTQAKLKLFQNMDFLAIVDDDCRAISGAVELESSSNENSESDEEMR